MDAIDSFDLDSTEWKEHSSVETITDLFSEFGFRNMTARISKLFDITLVDDVAEAAKVDAEELQKASILLWILESERTNADYNDIIEYGRSFLQVTTWDDTVVELEKKAYLLSGDMIHDQEHLYEIQEVLCNMMVESANKNAGIGEILRKELPYLFKEG